jgi:hypothetical protein
MKHLLTLVAVAGSLFFQSQIAQSQPKEQHPAGEIKGTVTDHNGTPIALATVYAVPQDLTLNDITPRSVKTDKNGNFDFRGGFELGAYKLYSKKDEEAYLDPFDNFYADAKADAPKVELTEDHPSSTVAVKLGQKAGVVAGRVVDADTGAALKATVFFVDGQGHGHHFESAPDDGKFRALVPPGKELTLMVRVEGSPSERMRLPVAPVRLEPGQYVYIDLPVSAR